MIQSTQNLPHSVRMVSQDSERRVTPLVHALSPDLIDGGIRFVRGITAPGMSTHQVREILGLEPEVRDPLARLRELDGADLDEPALNQWDTGDDTLPPAA